MRLIASCQCRRFVNRLSNPALFYVPRLMGRRNREVEECLQISISESWTINDYIIINRPHGGWQHLNITLSSNKPILRNTWFYTAELKILKIPYIIRIEKNTTLPTNPLEKRYKSGFAVVGESEIESNRE